MAFPEYRIGKKAKDRPHCRATDIDWEKVRKHHNGKPAKEIAKAVGCSLICVYQSSYEGKIEIGYVYKGLSPRKHKRDPNPVTNFGW